MLRSDYRCVGGGKQDNKHGLLSQRPLAVQHGRPPHDDEVKHILDSQANGSVAPLSAAAAVSGGYDTADDEAFIADLLSRAEAEATALQAALAASKAAIHLPALASLGEALRGILVSRSDTPLQVRWFSVSPHDFFILRRLLTPHVFSSFPRQVSMSLQNLTLFPSATIASAHDASGRLGALALLAIPPGSDGTTAAPEAQKVVISSRNAGQNSALPPNKARTAPPVPPAQTCASFPLAQGHSHALPRPTRTVERSSALALQEWMLSHCSVLLEYSLPPCAAAIGAANPDAGHDRRLGESVVDAASASVADSAAAAHLALNHARSSTASGVHVVLAAQRPARPRSSSASRLAGPGRSSAAVASVPSDGSTPRAAPAPRGPHAAGVRTLSDAEVAVSVPLAHDRCEPVSFDDAGLSLWLDASLSVNVYLDVPAAAAAAVALPAGQARVAVAPAPPVRVLVGTASVPLRQLLLSADLDVSGIVEVRCSNVRAGGEAIRGAAVRSAKPTTATRGALSTPAGESDDVAESRRQAFMASLDSDARARVERFEQIRRGVKALREAGPAKAETPPAPAAAEPEVIGLLSFRLRFLGFDHNRLQRSSSGQGVAPVASMLALFPGADPMDSRALHHPSAVTVTSQKRGPSREGFALGPEFMMAMHGDSQGPRDDGPSDWALVMAAAGRLPSREGGPRASQLVQRLLTAPPGADMAAVAASRLQEYFHETALQRASGGAGSKGGLTVVLSVSTVSSIVPFGRLHSSAAQPGQRCPASRVLAVSVRVSTAPRALHLRDGTSASELPLASRWGRHGDPLLRSSPAGFSAATAVPAIAVCCRDTLFSLAVGASSDAGLPSHDDCGSATAQLGEGSITLELWADVWREGRGVSRVLLGTLAVPTAALLPALVRVLAAPPLLPRAAASLHEKHSRVGSTAPALSSVALAGTFPTIDPGSGASTASITLSLTLYATGMTAEVATCQATAARAIQRAWWRCRRGGFAVAFATPAQLAYQRGLRRVRDASTAPPSAPGSDKTPDEPVISAPLPVTMREESPQVLAAAESLVQPASENRSAPVTTASAPLPPAPSALCSHVRHQLHLLIPEVCPAALSGDSASQACLVAYSFPAAVAASGDAPGGRNTLEHPASAPSVHLNPWDGRVVASASHPLPPPPLSPQPLPPRPPHHELVWSRSDARANTSAVHSVTLPLEWHGCTPAETLAPLVPDGYLEFPDETATEGGILLRVWGPAVSGGGSLLDSAQDRRIVGVTVLPREVVLAVVEQAWQGWAEAGCQMTGGDAPPSFRALSIAAATAASASCSLPQATRAMRLPLFRPHAASQSLRTPLQESSDGDALDVVLPLVVSYRAVPAFEATPVQLLAHRSVESTSITTPSLAPRDSSDVGHHAPANPIGDDSAALSETTSADDEQLARPSAPSRHSMAAIVTVAPQRPALSERATPNHLLQDGLQMLSDSAPATAVNVSARDGTTLDISSIAFPATSNGARAYGVLQSRHQYDAGNAQNVQGGAGSRKPRESEMLDSVSQRRPPADRDAHVPAVEVAEGDGGAVHIVSTVDAMQSPAQRILAAEHTVIPLPTPYVPKSPPLGRPPPIPLPLLLSTLRVTVKVGRVLHLRCATPGLPSLPLVYVATSWPLPPPATLLSTPLVLPTIEGGDQGGDTPTTDDRGSSSDASAGMLNAGRLCSAVWDGFESMVHVPANPEHWAAVTGREFVAGPVADGASLLDCLRACIGGRTGPGLSLELRVHARGGGDSGGAPSLVPAASVDPGLAFLAQILGQLQESRSSTQRGADDGAASRLAMWAAVGTPAVPASSDRLVGVARLPMLHLLANGRVEGWFDVVSTAGPANRIVGQISASVEVSAGPVLPHNSTAYADRHVARTSVQAPLPNAGAVSSPRIAPMSFPTAAPMPASHDTPPLDFDAPAVAAVRGSLAAVRESLHSLMLEPSGRPLPAQPPIIPMRQQASDIVTTARVLAVGSRDAAGVTAAAVDIPESEPSHALVSSGSAVLSTSALSVDGGDLCAESHVAHEKAPISQGHSAPPLPEIHSLVVSSPLPDETVHLPSQPTPSPRMPVLPEQPPRPQLPMYSGRPAALDASPSVSDEELSVSSDRRLEGPEATGRGSDAAQSTRSQRLPSPRGPAAIEPSPTLAVPLQFPSVLYDSDSFELDGGDGGDDLHVSAALASLAPCGGDTLETSYSPRGAPQAAAPLPLPALQRQGSSPSSGRSSLPSPTSDAELDALVSAFLQGQPAGMFDKERAPPAPSVQAAGPSAGRHDTGATFDRSSSVSDSFQDVYAAPPASLVVIAVSDSAVAGGPSAGGSEMSATLTGAAADAVDVSSERADFIAITAAAPKANADVVATSQSGGHVFGAPEPVSDTIRTGAPRAAVAATDDSPFHDVGTSFSAGYSEGAAAASHPHDSISSFHESDTLRLMTDITALPPVAELLPPDSGSIEPPHHSKATPAVSAASAIVAAIAMGAVPEIGVPVQSHVLQGSPAVPSLSAAPTPLHAARPLRSVAMRVPGIGVVMLPVLEDERAEEGANDTAHAATPVATVAAASHVPRPAAYEGAMFPSQSPHHLRSAPVSEAVAGPPPRPSPVLGSRIGWDRPTVSVMPARQALREALAAAARLAAGPDLGVGPDYVSAPPQYVRETRRQPHSAPHVMNHAAAAQSAAAAFAAMKADDDTVAERRTAEDAHSPLRGHDGVDARGRSLPRSAAALLRVLQGQGEAASSVSKVLPVSPPPSYERDGRGALAVTRTAAELLRASLSVPAYSGTTPAALLETGLLRSVPRPGGVTQEASGNSCDMGTGSGDDEETDAHVQRLLDAHSRRIARILTGSGPSGVAAASYRPGVAAVMPLAH